MKRPGIIASSLLALLLLAAPAAAVEIFIDVQSDRAAPSFRVAGAPPHQPWGHPMPVLGVELVAGDVWRVRTSFPDEWGCGIFWIVENLPGETAEAQPWALPSQNMIRFGECPDPPLTPVEEPAPDLLVRSGLASLVLLASLAPARR